MKYTIHIAYLFILLSLSSCFKKEDLLILPEGHSEITTLYLGQDYTKEMFFDLGSNSYKSSESIDWDMKFQSSKDGYGIFLNTGNFISARKIEVGGLGEFNSNDTFNILKFPKLIDAPEGSIEKSALGDWRTYKYLGNVQIYVVELSYLSGNQRYKRLKILNYNDSSYKIVVADIGDTAGDTMLIAKDKQRNYTYFTFKNGGKVVSNQEPSKELWDIQFTRYNHFFPDILPNGELFPYRVLGVLSNPNKVEIARDSMNRYENLNASSIKDYTFSKDLNAIGFDWKEHAFGAQGTYTINPNISFIIKDTEGFYYKFHFIDFYNPQGDKGYPKFEFERIK
ncbi:MAG: HmuY family protein [Bacteroidia bacterium]